MPYILTSEPVRRRLPAAVALFRGRRGVGDYNLGDQPLTPPTFPNLPSIDVGPAPYVPPPIPSFLSLPALNPPSSSVGSQLLTALPSLAQTGVQIAAVAGGANPGSTAAPAGSGLTQAQWNSMTPAQQQAYLAQISGSSASWFSQSTILPWISNGWLLAGGGGLVLFLGLLIRGARKR
jgi:hypothetical protein